MNDEALGDKAIAAGIGGVLRAQVEMVYGDETITVAAQRMRWNNEGVVVVIDEDQIPIGILTDRDLTLRVIAAERDPSTTLVSQVMTCDVAVIRPDATIKEALEQMAQRVVRRLPVVDETGVLVGVVTFDDLVRAQWNHVPQIGKILRWAVPLPPVLDL